MSHQIFVSYSRNNKSRVLPLVTALTEKGWSVYWDHKLKMGTTWEEHIETNLDTATVALVIWSTESVKSEWVRAEARRAKRLGKYAPVLIDRVDLPLEFDGLSVADLVGWPSTDSLPYLPSLIEQLEERLGPLPTAAVEAIPDRPTREIQRNEVGVDARQTGRITWKQRLTIWLVSYSIVVTLGMVLMTHRVDQLLTCSHASRDKLVEAIKQADGINQRFELLWRLNEGGDVKGRETNLHYGIENTKLVQALMGEARQALAKCD